jgi:hypothetical protein
LFGSPPPVAIHVIRRFPLAARFTVDCQPVTIAGLTLCQALPSVSTILVVVVSLDPQPWGIVRVSVPFLPAVAVLP